MMFSGEFENKIMHYFGFYYAQCLNLRCFKNDFFFNFSMLFCSVEGLGDLADKSPQSCIALINEIMSQFTYLAKV